MGGTTNPYLVPQTPNPNGGTTNPYGEQNQIATMPPKAGTPRSGTDPTKTYATKGAPIAGGRSNAPTMPTTGNIPGGAAGLMGGGNAYDTQGQGWQGHATTPVDTTRTTGGGPDPYGTQSGPGILEQWFNSRANGTDPGYEYAMTRGMNDIDSRMAAGGSYNSGARGQQLGDFAANMGAQREGQLDALAGGASGEHQNRFNSMIQQMLGSAGGQAGTMGAYDMKSAGSNDALMQALLMMMANKAGVDSKSNQQGIGNLIGLGSLL